MVKSNLKKLKVAILHDILVHSGGAENVVRGLLKIFPDADVYTSIDNRTKELKDIRKNLRMSWNPPFFVNKYSFLSKIFVHSYWESIDLKDYDLVISSSDDYSSKSAVTGPETLHICYCHTPPRFLYPEYSSSDDTKTLISFKKNLLLAYLRVVDYLSSQRPDVFVANSIEVGKRIKKYYRREAVVINPPVEVPKRLIDTKNRSDYYLYVGALDKRKGVELAVKVFNKLGKELVIIGSGGQFEYLNKIAKKNVRFLGYVSQNTKDKYYKKAKGFIFPSIEEDFGIAPVEAMSYGLPVFAYKSGGLTETVLNGKTGCFFDEFSEDSFINSFQKFEKKIFDSKIIYKHSLKYSSDLFRKRFIDLVTRELNKREKRGIS